MAPIKFEENIKETLEQRKLQPSGQAWNSLSKRLDESNKKTKKPMWWLGIAASFIGILFMVNMFFNASKTKKNESILVDTESVEVKEKQLEVNEKLSKTLLVQEEVKKENLNISEEKIVLKNNVEVAVLTKTNQKKKASLIKKQPKQKSEEIINNLNIETDLGVNSLAENSIQKNEAHTETDIDALLKKAQQNLAINSTENTYAIDAQLLLEEVEEDSNKSLRAIVFKTIKKNYKKVKTAVAERNN